MADYSVRVTYTVGGTKDTRGYTVAAKSTAEAEQKGRAAHREQGEPGTPIVSVAAHRL